MDGSLPTLWARVDRNAPLFNAVRVMGGWPVPLDGSRGGGERGARVTKGVSEAHGGNLGGISSPPTPGPRWREQASRMMPVGARAAKSFGVEAGRRPPAETGTGGGGGDPSRVSSAGLDRS